MSAVTIGLPVYNGAPYLDGALRALCAQSFADLTILIADNASSDDSAQVISQWAMRDSRIRVHRHATNIGALPNFRWVLEQADSPWFMYAAHDDQWNPDFVSELFGVITARPGLEIAIPKMVNFEDVIEQPSKIRPYPERISRLAIRGRVSLALRRARPGWIYSLFSRQRLLAAMQAAQALNQAWGEDVLAQLNVLVHGGITGSNEAIYYRRSTPQSAASYRPKTAAAHFALYRKFLGLAFQALRAAPLSSLERLSLMPALLHYARYVGKPTSILKAAVRERLRHTARV
jgi:glycosyltransferase involved in cell wall biosynthesis